jgi:Na+-transporting NADH:ubiquinone oxidoreductase subunit A
MPNVIKIRKGLDIPLKGEAGKTTVTAPRSQVYAVKPPDFHGLTPKMIVKEGDKVKAGSPLFFDKYNEKILFTSPVSGTFIDLIRGPKRRILEVRIQAENSDSYLDFGSADPSSVSREEIIDKMLNSGIWPVIRQRPYSMIAKPESNPRGIFISAFNSAPLAPDMDFIVKGQESLFQAGLNVLSRLTEGDVHLSVHASKTKSDAFLKAKGVKIHHFEGPHPAGNIGIQIHHINPINKGEVVWYVDVQDVIIIGRLFETGSYDAKKIIALTGSEVKEPKYYETITGARIDAVISGNVMYQEDVNLRYISGDVLSGTKITADGFLGFYDNQISIIPEGDKPQLLGWVAPNPDKFSISRTFFSFLLPKKKYRHTTNIRSGERPFVVTGLYEQVLPMDILPMQLVKAIMINDIDQMEQLGIYEVAPEDFALCEYVCPSKIEMQTIIREGLDAIYKEFE